MKNTFSTKILTAFSIALLMISILLFAMPVQAQDEGYLHGSPSQGASSGISGPLPAGAKPDLTVDTTAFLSFRPNPVGVGQTFLVNFWLVPAVSAGRVVRGYQLTFTKPDGTTDVINMDG